MHASDSPDASLEHLLHHRVWLRALSRRLVGPGLADDLAQETWLAAVRRPPDAGRPARPWLAAVARRLASRLRGDEGSEDAARGRAGGGGGGRGADGEREPASAAPSSAELLARLKTEARLAREVAALEEPFRRTVLLRYHEGLSAAEIARRDGVPAGTVRWRLKRGLDALRARLDRDFGERKQWVALLASLAGVQAGAGGAALAWKLGAAAALALALGGGLAWRARAAEPEVARAQPAPAARAEIEAVAPIQGDDGDPADALREEVGGGDRVALAVPARAEARPALRLAVVEPGGAPAVGVEVALRTRVEPPYDDPVVATTDELGLVAFGLERDAPVEIAVHRVFAPDFVARLEPDAATQRVELPAGAAVAGRVVIDGAPPREPLTLKLFESEGLEGSTFFGGDRPAWWFSGRQPLHAETDADGRFAFAGLRADFRGTLRLPRGHASPDAEPISPSGMHGAALFVREPTLDLLVRAERHPSLRGTIVEADGATQVKEARFYATIAWADPPGTTSRLGSLPNAQSGRIEVFYDHREVAGVEIEYSARNGRGRTVRALTASELAGDGDLGLLRLPPTRAATLAFSDADGAPIAGARVEGVGEASGPDGRLYVARIPTGPATIRAGGFGYRPRAVEVPADIDELAVVLERANHLALTLTDVDGRPIALGEIALSAEGVEPYLESSIAWAPDPLSIAGHRGSHTMTSTRDPITLHFRADAEGRVTLGPLQAGRPLRATFRDDLDVVLIDRPIPALGVDETRAVTLRVPVALHAFAARVVDRSGAPLRNASVRIAPAGEPQESGGRRTNDKGEMRVTRMLASRVDLVIEKEGYLPIDARAVPTDGVERVYVLERGLNVAVRVVDPSGAAVGGGRLEVGPEQDEAQETAIGRFDLRGLADQPIEVALLLAGRRYVQVHNARVPELVFEVPAHGAVELVWLGEGERPSARLTSADPAIQPLEGTFSGSSPICTVTPVLPGSYTAQAYVREEDETERALGAPAPVEVIAGETTRVELR